VGKKAEENLSYHIKTSKKPPQNFTYLKVPPGARRVAREKKHVG